MPLFPPDRLASATKAVFFAAGVPDGNARLVAEALVDANLVGHDAHGVMRIPMYLAAIRNAEVDPKAEPRVIRESEVSALVDGGWGLGLVTAIRATEVAIRLARANGLAAVAAVRCYHIGRLGAYGELAAKEGLIAFVVAGGFRGRAARAAPYGGAEALFGTNPLAFGFPDSTTGVGLLVDFATTATAEGKLQMLRARRQPVPAGLILDAQGQPSTDAEAFYAGGMLLPFGGHKGYGLSLVVELLGRVLTGSDSYANGEHGNEVFGKHGLLVLAIDPGMFRDRATFDSEARATLARVKAVKPAEGFTEVLIPGEPEARTRAARIRDGIHLDQITVDAIAQAAETVGASFEALLAPA